MTPRVGWAQALAWRMERHLLSGSPAAEAIDVVRRLCGVQAQVPSAAEIGIRVRAPSEPGGVVEAALGSGRLVRTWAMRGTLHLLAPDDAGIYLSLIAAARPWEKPAWSNWFGLTPEVIARMTEVASDALADGPLTRDELIAALTAEPGLAHIGTPLRESWGTAFKPLAWQGVLAVGPIRDGRPTFVRPDRASPAWSALPAADDAAPHAIAAYLAAYGPATPDRFHRWMGRLSKRRVTAWWRAAGDLLAEVEVDGVTAYLGRDHLEELLAAEPSNEVRLVPGFDQWVLGPGTDDAHVTPPSRRPAVSRQSGWISPVVLRGGVVAGTWKRGDDAVEVDWFAEAGRPPHGALRREARRIGKLLGRDLHLHLEVVAVPPMARGGAAPQARRAAQARPAPQARRAAQARPALRQTPTP